uniref:Uncharacterized protein n=1 Tax=Nelumbo nucifera TaxID=4432 RepID=A0A822Y611_NELNU|nr:TPA_asm: hypothetical protein HUJ06_028921 [Nelumbo nucifera]
MTTPPCLNHQHSSSSSPFLSPSSSSPSFNQGLEMDEAIKVFCEMGLYGLCEKGRVSQGLGFYKEMRGKGLPLNGTDSLRFQDEIDVLFDVLNNSMVPDLLTYKTLFEDLCREGRGNEAFQLLEELRKKEGSMEEKTYKTLLDGLHFSCWE